MAGRTARVNARDVMDRADGILFEGEAIRSWVTQLKKRAKGAVDAGRKNPVIEDEWKTEYAELSKALKALEEAEAQLEVFAAAVEKRERTTE